MKFKGTRMKFKGTRMKFKGTRMKFKGTRMKFKGTRMKFKGTRIEFNGTRMEFKGTRMLPNPERFVGIWLDQASSISDDMASMTQTRRSGELPESSSRPSAPSVAQS
jgi:hypothetical protein